MIKTLAAATLVTISSHSLAAASGATETRTHRGDIVCSPTIQMIRQEPFVVQRVAAQSDISNLEEMTKNFYYGNIYFKVAIDTQGNYRIRCNQISPYSELLIAQGRMPENDPLFIDFATDATQPSARVRIECADTSHVR